MRFTLTFCEYFWRRDSPYINHFLQPDTIIPNLANPQSWNRFSYVLNSPIRFNDPTGHMVADDEDGGMATAGYAYVAQQKKKEEDKEDNELSMTLSRDELDVIEDFADQLGNYYREWGQLWGWGVGGVAGVGMLMVDGLACTAAVGSAGVLTGGCVAAIYLTLFGVPSVGIVAGELGGGIASDDAYALGGYISEALADNPDPDEFTISIQKNTHHETILPGGVGPTVTNYSIQITGMDSPATVSGYAGDEIISKLFGVTQ